MTCGALSCLGRWQLVACAAGQLQLCVRPNHCPPFHSDILNGGHVPCLPLLQSLELT